MPKKPHQQKKESRRHREDLSSTTSSSAAAATGAKKKKNEESLTTSAAAAAAAGSGGEEQKLSELQTNSSGTTTDILFPQQGDASTGTSTTLAARIFLPEEHIDRETKVQVEAMAQHPSVQHVRVMPDCHKGNGCCVGFTAQLAPSGGMSPQLIGGDIGCGISAHPLPAQLVERKKGLDKLLNIIHALVPMGNGHRCIHSEPVVQWSQYGPFLEEATTLWHSFSQEYCARYGLDLDRALSSSSEHGSGGSEREESPAPSTAPATFSYTVPWVQQRLKTLGVDERTFLCNMGTLGGGNHFMEVDQRATATETTATVDADDGAEGRASALPLPEYYLVVHSGSRCLGQAIYRYFTEAARQEREALRESHQQTLAASRDRSRAAEGDGGEKNDTPTAGKCTVNDEDDETIPFDGKLLLRSPRLLAEYFLDMIFAQQYAAMNRLTMLSLVLSALRPSAPPSGGYDDGCQGDVGEEEAEEEEDADVCGEGEDHDDEVPGSEEEREGEESSGGAIECDEDETEEQQRPSLFTASQVVSSVHNYIDFADFIIRKGAIRAHSGETCLIALNMRDGFWLCRGTGNEDWNRSAAHGCGRVVPRGKCGSSSGTGSRKKGRASSKGGDQVLLQHFREEMGDVVSQSVSLSTVDERPSAYRNPAVVATALIPSAVSFIAHYTVLLSAKGA